MASLFIRSHLINPLENVMDLLQKFEAFMDESLDINMKIKRRL